MLLSPFFLLPASGVAAQPVTLGGILGQPCQADGRGFSPICPSSGRMTTVQYATARRQDKAFLPLWKELPDRAGWQMLVSPPFPGIWPPDGRGTLVRYAFAMRLNPAVADGAEIAAPWARSTLAAGGGMVVERLSSHLQPLGVQGVRPLSSAEMVLIGREQEVSDRLMAGDEQSPDGLVRDFTCDWLGRQGVVAAAITPRHPAFVRWLACR